MRLIGFFAATAVAMVIVSCVSNAVTSSRAAKAKASLANVQNRCESIQKETQAAKAELDQHQWQDQLAAVSNSWLSIIDTAVDCLPADAWITRIETSPKDSTILIEGRAATFDSLSVFIGELRRNPAFAEIRLSSARIIGIGSTLRCVEFAVPIKLGASSAENSPDATAQVNDPAVVRGAAAPLSKAGAVALQRRAGV